MRVFALLAAVLAAAPAGAQVVGPVHMTVPQNGTGKVLINNVALNAAAASRTLTLSTAAGSLPVRGYGVLVLSVKRTRNAGSDLTMTCTQSPDGGTTDFPLAECESAAASGVCTYYQQTWKDAGSVSANWTWRVDILGYSEVECVFASTSANGSDLLTVTGSVVTQ